MENRTIAIANTKTQRRYQIESSATTLGELQDEMLAQGIDFTGMTFTEGISKTQLLSRDSLLPTNVMYKGQPTNNLVMLLTNTTKQISSGACDERGRKEAYKILKEWGKESQDEIKDIYGKNYTLVKTDLLWQYIDENADEDYDDEPEENDEEDETPKVEGIDSPNADTVEWIFNGIKAAYNEGILYNKDIVALTDLVKEFCKSITDGQAFSDDDIDNIIAGI